MAADRPFQVPLEQVVGLLLALAERQGVEKFELIAIVNVVGLAAFGDVIEQPAKLGELIVAARAQPTAITALADFFGKGRDQQYPRQHAAAQPEDDAEQEDQGQQPDAQ